MERKPVTNVEHLFNQIGFYLKSIVTILCIFKIKGRKKLVIKIVLPISNRIKKKPIDTTRTDFIFTIQDFKVLCEIMVRFIVSLFSALNFFSVKKKYYYNLSSKLFRLQMAKIITLHNFSCDQILTIS